jgi:hypothetical protein
VEAEAPAGAEAELLEAAEAELPEAAEAELPEAAEAELPEAAEAELLAAAEAELSDLTSVLMRAFNFSLICCASRAVSRLRCFVRGSKAVAKR